jgi:hypothetical protein
MSSYWLLASLVEHITMRVGNYLLWIVLAIACSGFRLEVAVELHCCLREEMAVSNELHAF